MCNNKCTVVGFNPTQAAPVCGVYHFFFQGLGRRGLMEQIFKLDKETNAALAHSLWLTILPPNTDYVIDATCGNGHDLVAFLSSFSNSANTIGSIACSTL
jgi:hypothetical protein